MTTSRDGYRQTPCPRKPCAGDGHKLYYEVVCAPCHKEEQRRLASIQEVARAAETLGGGQLVIFPRK